MKKSKAINVFMIIIYMVAVVKYYINNGVYL